ncbi:MAG TPA: MATE family efflux transporter [Burkholderiaceae bacterium]|nr:MATE family efflux transporter [Burkholderiaceae bacterium]
MLTRLLAAWRHWPTHKQVWALAIPMILSNLTVPLVALVDSSVIGHLPHPHQLGAVAVGAGFYTMIASLAGTTLRMGITGFAARATGQSDDATARRIFQQAVVLAVSFAAVLIVVALPLTNFALSVMGSSDELRDLARRFFQIRIFGMPAILMQHALVGWLLGRQNARGPLAIMLTTNVLNIILVLWLVLGLEWGVPGAAVASVSAEWIGGIFALGLVRRHLRRMQAAPSGALALRSWKVWGQLLAANRDIFIRTLALQAVFLSVTLRGAQLGDETVAANALLLNGLLVCSYALDGLAHAIEALCGHAIGAGKRRALLRALTVAGGWSLGISMVFSFGFALIGDWFIALQTNMPGVRAMAGQYLGYLALLPLVAVWSFLLDGLFIAGTKAREMRNVMVVSLLLTVPLALVLWPLGNHGLWTSLLCFMAIRGVGMGLVARRLDQHQAWVAQA